MLKIELYQLPQDYFFIFRSITAEVIWDELLNVLLPASCLPVEGRDFFSRDWQSMKVNEEEFVLLRIEFFVSQIDVSYRKFNYRFKLKDMLD